MFAYADPTGGNFLAQAGALDNYRELLDEQYERFAKVGNSAFTLLEAFDELSPGTSAIRQTVEWRGFPISAQGTSFADIDSNRLRFQDEYIEWWTEHDQQGNLSRVTFTSEFPEYFESFAQVGANELKREIQNIIPGANPTDLELFGAELPATATGRTRAKRFRDNLENNPWNVGPKGILCLTQQFNTLGALFNLVGICGIDQPGLPAGSVCANVGGACGAGRNSDPAICQAVQQLAKDNFACTLSDPVGVVIRRLAGNWSLGDQAIDINDLGSNQGAWIITRNGRRAILNISGALRLNGSKPRTGTDVADNLFVGANVQAAPNTALPVWARTGSEQQIRGVA